MNIEFKTREQLLQMGRDKPKKDYTEQNDAYLEYVNYLVEATARHGEHSICEVIKDAMIYFLEHASHKYSLYVQDDRTWDDILLALEMLLSDLTDWKVTSKKARFYHGTEKYLNIYWGEDL